MATKKQAEERVQNYPSLFPELEGGTYGGILKATKEPRRRLNASRAGKWTGNKKTSRQRRNRKAWESLYPTPCSPNSLMRTERGFHKT